MIRLTSETRLEVIQAESASELKLLIEMIPQDVTIISLYYSGIEHCAWIARHLETKPTEVVLETAKSKSKKKTN